MLAKSAALVSLVLLGVGVWAFFSDAPGEPDVVLDVLDVLDKRASVVSMFAGVLGLLISTATLWTQLRPSGPRPGGDVLAWNATGGDEIAITGGHLAAAVRQPPRPRPPARPVRLPPRPPQLAGRDQTLAELHERLAGDGALPHLIAVHGLGGVGKTSLVVEYAHRYLHEYTLVWHLPAEDTALLSAAYANLAALLAVRQATDLADPVDQVHAALAAYPGRWLLIFDNAPFAEALRAFLPPAGPGHVLVTSRSAHWPFDHGLELDVLDAEPAMAFLQARAGQEDQDGAAAVVTALGALPLALEQAGAYMADTGTTITGYHGLLQHQRSTMLAQGEPWGYPSRVASTWQLAFETLAATNVQAISLIRLLACYDPDAIPYRLLLTPLEARHPQDLLVTDELRTQRGRTLEALRSLPGSTLGVNAAISLLRRHCLIGLPAADRVSIHRLVQAVTLDNVSAASRAAWQRAACALLHAVFPAGGEVEADAEDTANWPRFAQLLPHARALLPLDDPNLCKIAWYLGVSGDYRTAKLLSLQIHEHRAGTLGPEHPRTLSIRRQLIRWLGQAGDPAAARDQAAALVPVCERVLGPEHPNTLIARHELAHWSGASGAAAATVRDQYVLLLPYVRKVLGDDDGMTLRVRHTHAIWTGRAGDPAGARDQLAAIHLIAEHVMGDGHPVTLHIRYALASWTGEAGDAAAARDQVTTLLPDLERLLGGEHPVTLKARHSLASWTGEAGDAAAARDQFAALLPDLERLIGPVHPTTLAARRALADWTSRAR
ncbi:hypothetical protein GCM10009850_092460 [Nonomuraea monospora]|uniref:Orc1-like AAA ATPase domain-containing protein n=1 Tax=Nonomuraea monospora TaxID=568818 RepID=A0ABP5PSI9_9ACTN